MKQGEQYIPYSFLLPIFSLCFSISFLRDHGKKQGCFAEWGSEDGGGSSCSALLFPSQVFFFLVSACFLKTSLSSPTFCKAWNGSRRFKVSFSVFFSAEIRESRISNSYSRCCFFLGLPYFLNLFSFGMFCLLTPPHDGV